MPAARAATLVEAELAKERERKTEQFWLRNRDRVWRLVLRLCGNPDLADDLTQEVALRAHEALAGFRGRAGEFTWLYRIAVNVVRRYRERRQVETVSWDAPQLSRIPSPASPSEDGVGDFRRIVRAALLRLPEELSTPLILQVYEGLKYREIAQVLEIPIGTVMSRLHAARKRLREELKDVL